MRATYMRTVGDRHLFAAYELGEDKLYGHIKPRFLEFRRCPRSPAMGGCNWPGILAQAIRASPPGPLAGH
jgi:hypothetical protein